MQPALSGKTFVVTGATSGIGYAAAAQFVSQGAAVIGVGRSEERCRAAQAQLSEAHPGARVEFCVADLTLQSQVHQLADEIGEKLSAAGVLELDGLINNAGMFSFEFTQTAEGFQIVWALNHLAPFLLTYRLLPLLKAAPMGRVVTVSSYSHNLARFRWNDVQLQHFYNGLSSYKQSKMANVLFTAELNRRLGAQSKLRAFAADPGLVKTDIAFKGTPTLIQWIWKLRRSSGITPEESARGVVYLASEPSIQDSSEVYWKHSVPKTPDRYALKPENGRRLWEISEQMCGIKTEGLL
jgi:retinol dehydrogenase 12